MRRGYDMNSRIAMVLIVLVAVSLLGGITIGVTESENGVKEGFNLIIECDGDDPPPDPTGHPGGDPEHPH